ncbi:MAG: AraC family transcriptional regulator [Oscillospiraceae bacterium]|nr:AraC family transcriptional regulator [Oscillospiraceae bacterium]
MPAKYEHHILHDPDFPVIFHFDTLHENQSIFVHWHENPELLFFKRGDAVVYCDTVEINSCAGDLIVVNSGALHTIHSKSPLCEYYCLIIDKTFCENFELPVREIHLRSPISDEKVQASFDFIAKEMNEQNLYFKAAIKAEVISLMVRLFRISPAQPACENKHSRHLDMVRKSIRYIRQNYKEQISIDDICNHVGYTKYYFCRVFREITGKTVIDTVNFMRCDYARTLLLSGRFNVGESAELSGFNNLSYFSKMYKRHMGVLPSETWQISEREKI